MTAFVFTGAFILIFAKSMATEIASDEHAFLAGGALWARGLLPYRDFHYNHLPTLVLIYRLMFAATDHLLLASRTFACLCAAGIVATLFNVAYRLFEPLSIRYRWLLSLAVAIIVLTNPLFTLTSGLAWNHDFPTLMTLLAYFAACRAVRHHGNLKWSATAGLLIGLAFTARLTFGPAAAALAMMMLIAGDPRKRLLLVGVFLIGILTASIPTLYIIAQSPENALWGNLHFPQLNTAYHLSRGAARITFWSKIWFLFRDLFQRTGNGALVIAAVAALIPIWIDWRRSVRAGKAINSPRAESAETSNTVLSCRWDLSVLVVMLSCLWLGCFFPSPIFRQYFYGPMPLFVVVLLVCWRQTVNKRRAEIWIIVVAVISLVTSGYRYRHVGILATPGNWHPMREHVEGVALRQTPGTGRILTLGPTSVLEGGNNIYLELATGPYAYRVSSLLPTEKRRQLVLMSPDDARRMILESPPRAILTGYSKTEDAKLIELAKSLGYVATSLPTRRRLWTLPSHTANGSR